MPKISSLCSSSASSSKILQQNEQKQKLDEISPGMHTFSSSTLSLSAIKNTINSSFLAKIISSIVRENNLTGLTAIVILFSCTLVESRAPPEPYYGGLIGPFKDYAHGIAGTVYAVDESTLLIKGFSYDGTGPDAFFWVGKTPRPSPEGYIIPYPEEYTGRDPPILQAYNNTDIMLRLPMGKRIRDIRWLSVWCRRFTVDFGEVFIPVSLDVPKPRVLPEFKRLAHGLRSSNISVLDAKTFYIPNLHYDGAGPDAYFWVGNGTEPNIMGIKVPNEMGSLEPLRGYQGEDIEIQLPGNLTVYDIDWLAVWCVQYRHNFGHVFIPKNLEVPPALGQTKIATTTTTRPQSSNCREILDGRLQVKWEIQGENIEIKLYGRIREDQYMAFGLSGFQGRPQMVGGDVTVAFYDTSAKVFRAEDYYLSHLSQCDGNQGVCPDERIGGRNDVQFVTGSLKNGVTTITYRRPLQTNEPVNDRAIPTDREVSVIAAIGPLNSRREANAHSHNGMDVNVDDIQINFSSKMDHACTSSLYDIKDDKKGPTPWPTRILSDEFIITARIGPTGGKRGYTPITGNPSWGIAWYLNDLLIPELYVERGQTYMFSVEGGDKPTQPAKYHPFYITDSNEGGFGQKSEAEQRKQKVYAGVEYDEDGYPIPTAAGRYCEWEHMTIDKSEEIETFEEYVKTLYLECLAGEPAILNWTVPMDAPDLLYYQCYTHNNLGWKINVVDAGHSLHRNHIPSITSKMMNVEMLLIIAITVIFISSSNMISSIKNA